MSFENAGLNFIKTSVRNVKNLLTTKPCARSIVPDNSEILSRNSKHKVSVFSSLKNKITEFQDNIKVKMIKMGMKMTLGLSSPVLTEYISKDFNKIKSQLLKTSLDENILKKIDDCKTPEEITNIIKMVKIEETNKILDVNKTISSNLSVYEKQNILQKAYKPYNSKMVELEKALSLPSVDPKVVEIESILKNKYGFEFVSLKDDYEHAQKVLKACEIMTKNGQPLPKNYIVSNMLNGSGQNFKSESTVILSSSKLDKVINPKSAKEKAMAKKLYSTDSELHVIIHELGHNLQPEMIHTYELPKQFKKVPNTISKYANSGSLAELWAELYAKIQLAPKTVTNEQRQLFEHLKSLSAEERILSEVV